MGDIGLLHRADCSALGVESQFAAAVKDDLTLYLCRHHRTQHTPELIRKGWKVVVLDAADDDCDTEVVPA